MEGISLKDEFTDSVTGFPVIFLKGSHSNYLTAADIVSIRKVFPASEFIVINGAGHWIHADQPDEVIKNLRKLLDDH